MLYKPEKPFQATTAHSSHQSETDCQNFSQSFEHHRPKKHNPPSSAVFRSSWELLRVAESPPPPSIHAAQGEIVTKAEHLCVPVQQEIETGQIQVMYFYRWKAHPRGRQQGFHWLVVIPGHTLHSIPHWSAVHHLVPAVERENRVFCRSESNSVQRNLRPKISILTLKMPRAEEHKCAAKHLVWANAWFGKASIQDNI